MAKKPISAKAAKKRSFKIAMFGLGGLIVLVACAFFALHLVSLKNQPSMQSTDLTLGRVNATITSIDDEHIEANVSEAVDGLFNVGDVIEMHTDGFPAESLAALSVGEDVAIMYSGEVPSGNHKHLHNVYAVAPVDSEASGAEQEAPIEAEASEPTITSNEIAVIDAGAGADAEDVFLTEEASAENSTQD